MKRATPSTSGNGSESDESYDDRRASTSSGSGTKRGREGETTEIPGGKTKRTRSRKHLSCEPCRQRRVKCDRRSECSNCRLHGLTCFWHEAAPTTVSDSDTIRQLQEEVAQLHQLIRILTTPPDSPQVASSSSLPPLPPTALPPAPSLTPDLDLFASMVRDERLAEQNLLASLQLPFPTPRGPIDYASYFPSYPTPNHASTSTSLSPPLPTNNTSMDFFSSPAMQTSAPSTASSYASSPSVGSQLFASFQNFVGDLTPASLASNYSSHTLLPTQLVNGGRTGGPLAGVNNFWSVGAY